MRTGALRFVWIAGRWILREVPVMTPEPVYLVQTEDNVLHAYWNADILACSLRENRGERVKLFKLARAMGAIRYLPTTEAEIRKAAGFAPLEHERTEGAK
jgi:hypothetical protein